MSLLNNDFWEHAYCQDYKSQRSRYLDNIWKIVNWKKVKVFRLAFRDVALAAREKMKKQVGRKLVTSF